MKNYLSLCFKQFSTPSLNTDGNIVREKNGATIYAAVTADECLDIARRMSGGNIYSLPWFCDFDPEQRKPNGYLCLLDPNDPTRGSKKLDNLSGAMLKKIFRDYQAQNQCAVFGTGKCTQEFEICCDCPKYGTSACKNCQKRCQFCQQKVCKVFSYDKSVQNDNDSDMERRFEPVAEVDVERDVEDAECLLLLNNALFKVAEKKRNIYLQHKNGKSRQKLAEQYGYSSKIGIKRIIDEVEVILRSDPSLKDFFN
jgi:hypothetical protein